MVILDCRGQQCPHPVVQVRRQMMATPNTPLQVLVSEPAAHDNVSRLAANRGFQVAVTEEGNSFRLDLVPAPPTAGLAIAPASGPTVVLVASDQFGEGDPQLGQALMKNVLFILVESDVAPDLMFFVNGGAKLTVASSDVLEPLSKLADRGTDIATCGLCLEFFGHKETLAIGRVGNMLEISNTLQGAGRIVRL